MCNDGQWILLPEWNISHESTKESSPAQVAVNANTNCSLFCQTVLWSCLSQAVGCALESPQIFVSRGCTVSRVPLWAGSCDRGAVLERAGHCLSSALSFSGTQLETAKANWTVLVRDPPSWANKPQGLCTALPCTVPLQSHFHLPGSLKPGNDKYVKGSALL